MPAEEAEAAPAAATEEKDEPASDAFDDLFKPAKPAEEKPADAAPATSEDPFSSVQLQLPLRKWTDDTGAFEISARLLVVLDGKVRLLKETGRTTTVPLDRLSTEDRQYVEHVLAQHGRDAIKRVASN